MSTMDTLTAHDWAADQRRYVLGSPTIRAAIAFTAEALDRSLSEAGRTLARRILLAVVAGSEGLQPLVEAPLAHQTVYSAFRRALHFADLALITRSATGDDSPVLTPEASVALAEIETADPLVAASPALADSIAALLSGCAWRLG